MGRERPRAADLRLLVPGFLVSGFGIRDSGFGIRDSGFGYRGALGASVASWADVELRLAQRVARGAVEACTRGFVINRLRALTRPDQG